jgi:hypothetical protein
MPTLALATRGVARRCNNDAKHVFSNRDVKSAPFEACATANESFNIYLHAREVIFSAASHPVKRSVKNSLALPAIVKCRGDRILHSQPNTSNKAAVDRHTCIECIQSVGCSCASGYTVLSHDLYRLCAWRSWPDFSEIDSKVKFQNWRPTLALLVMDMLTTTRLSVSGGSAYARIGRSAYSLQQSAEMHSPHLRMASCGRRLNRPIWTAVGSSDPAESQPDTGAGWGRVTSTARSE